MAFVHLHVHSEYSLLDGACRLKELVRSVKAMGQEAVAVTDHGVMYGAVDFYKLAKAEGIKPIIGCEVYVAQKSRFDKSVSDRENRHMVLLCKNMEGYKNLIAMVSKSFTEGFYYKPRIDEELLKEYHDNLICLSACLAGEIPKLIMADDYEGAKQKALYYDGLFGRGNFYLELQDHGIDEQKEVCRQIRRISKETGIPLVATNDCHYISKQDSRMHEILLCIQTNHTINDSDKMEFATDEFYLKSEEEMRKVFLDCDEAFENTAKIADMCEIEFEFGKTKLPRFDIPTGEDNYEYFRRLCYEGLERNYGENTDDSLYSRLEFELGTIKTMGFVDYFLIVQDFVNYAKQKGIPVGPGRGSGAGSLAAYCIGITGIDPIKYDLYFERFLNPERVSMPDFDIDFCKERRQEVIDYVIRKYGEDHVSQIIAFGTMAAKGAIRDVGRALDIPYRTVDSVAKLVPTDLGMTLTKALEISRELKERYDTDPQIHELIDMAMKIEGMPRHATTHAAGVVITDKPVCEYVPLSKNDDAVVTQYEKTNIEKLGLLKMDFLGLRNLTLLSDVEAMVKEANPDFDKSCIKTDDKQVFKMLSSGLSEGVFQFESAGIKSVLAQMKPESIEDLIALTSLYRPGPMDSIPRYIENRHNPEKITYKHPLLEKILNVTYGCIVYQEQVMQIFRTLAGYSLGRADIVRRAMSKKDKATMEREKEIFINGLTDENGNVIVDGCVRRGIRVPVAISIFNEMESFASYAFNKSHAAAYANIAYETAWYKCHYTKEFMVALLSSVADNSSKLNQYINECKRLNISVLPPHVNESSVGFSVSGESIRYGLLAVKNLGAGVINAIIKEREKGKFTTFYDFCKRMCGKNMNSRCVESLIKCGALDNLATNRRQMLMSAKSVMDSLEGERRRNLEGQLNLFDMKSADNATAIYEPSFPNVPEYSHKELLSMEKEITGMYLSGHPMLEYDEASKAIGADSIADITNTSDYSEKYSDGTKIRVAGIITEVTKKTTKNNSMMAFVTLEDLSGAVEMLVFPKTFEQNPSLFSEGNVLDISATISTQDDNAVRLMCNFAQILPKEAKSIKRPLSSHEIQRNSTQFTKREVNSQPKIKRLYIKFPSKDSPLVERAELILRVFDGNTPVSYYYADEKRYEHLPSSCAVYLNDVMVKELEKRLGAENVVVK